MFHSVGAAAARSDIEAPGDPNRRPAKAANVLDLRMATDDFRLACIARSFPGFGHEAVDVNRGKGALRAASSASVPAAASCASLPAATPLVRLVLEAKNSPMAMGTRINKTTAVMFKGFDKCKATLRPEESLPLKPTKAGVWNTADLASLLTPQREGPSRRSGLQGSAASRRIEALAFAACNACRLLGDRSLTPRSLRRTRGRLSAQRTH